MSKDQEGIARLITLEIPEEKLRQDLDHFRQRAVEFGASMAEVIPAN